MSDLPIRFGQNGLVPAVIVDHATGDVLMIGFMNQEALETTRTTGFVHFWSRSRAELWKKGGTSGHVQEVIEIRINCDQNALLIEVAQTGAVCHDGFATCFYRRLEPDNALTLVRDRQFDPSDVYGSESGLASLTQRWWGAYEYLASNDLTAKSGTSRLLRGENNDLTLRIADELEELAGVLDGSHRHTTLEEDLRLEGSQVCYWLILKAIREQLTWGDIRPDRALDVAPDATTGTGTVVSLLHHQATAWRATDGRIDTGSLVHVTMSLVASAVLGLGVEPKSLIVADLQELRSRPYLAPYFAQQGIP